MVSKSNKIPPIERFWRSVRRTNSCWLWEGGKDSNGYGQFGVNGKSVLVHRFSYELHKGKIPTNNTYHGVCVLHICDTPNCVNPKHLVLGTQRENIKDRDNKGRLFAKINKFKADEIRSLYIPRKVSQYKLSKMFGVSRSTVEDIIHNRIWK